MNFLQSRPRERERESLNEHMHLIHLFRYSVCYENASLNSRFSTKHHSMPFRNINFISIVYCAHCVFGFHWAFDLMSVIYIIVCVHEMPLDIFVVTFFCWALCSLAYFVHGIIIMWICMFASVRAHTRACHGPLIASFTGFSHVQSRFSRAMSPLCSFVYNNIKCAWYELQLWPFLYYSFQSYTELYTFDALSLPFGLFLFISFAVYKHWDVLVSAHTQTHTHMLRLYR